MIGRVIAQDVSASYAAIGVVRTVTASRIAPAEADRPATRATDVVSLSSEAQGTVGRTTPTADDGGGSRAVDGAIGKPAPPQADADVSRSQRLTMALMGALDADRDGVLTKEEFVEGATSLLRASRGRHRRDAAGEHDDDVKRSERRHGHEQGHHRLERRLGRAFDRIDADDNGELNPAEIAAVLDRLPLPPRADGSAAPTEPAQAPTTSSQGGTGSTGAAGATGVPTPATPAQTPPSSTDPAEPSSGVSASWSVTTVTFVSVAIRQYQAVGQLQKQSEGV